MEIKSKKEVLFLLGNMAKNETVASKSRVLWDVIKFMKTN